MSERYADCGHLSQDSPVCKICALSNRVAELEHHLIDLQCGHGIPPADCKNAVAIITSVVNRAEAAEAELAEVKGRAHLDAEKRGYERGCVEEAQKVTKIANDVIEKERILAAEWMREQAAKVADNAGCGGECDTRTARIIRALPTVKSETK